MRAPKDFNPEWDFRAEWRKAERKTQGAPENYFGFEKWKWAACAFLDYEERFFAWLNAFKQTMARWDRCHERFAAFVHLAFSIILLRRIVREL